MGAFEALNTMLSFEQALQTVREKLTESPRNPAAEILRLEDARGRVLAEDVRADRDYPPFNRSTRDWRLRNPTGRKPLPSNTGTKLNK